VTVSLPSKQIFVVDLPEVQEFTGRFQYNFFVPDERVNDTGGVPLQFLQKTSFEFDAYFYKYSDTKLPRYVSFTFKPTVSQLKKSQPVVKQKSSNKGNLISSNIDNVMTEDEFSVSSFTSLLFHDPNADDKLHSLVSGSVSHAKYLQTENYKKYDDLTTLKSIIKKSGERSEILEKSLNLNQRKSGTRFFNKGNQFSDEQIEALKSVTVAAQVNNKYMNELVLRALSDPDVQYTGELADLVEVSKGKFSEALKDANSVISDDDYESFVKYIEVLPVDSSDQISADSEIVGYIIDKFEITEDGKRVIHPSIVIENSNATTAYDARVRYGSKYTYSIRSVALLTIPAIDDLSNKTVNVKILVSSKPSSRVTITAHESVAPPPPVDVSFTWDYERVNLTTAEFDSNTQSFVPNTGIAGSLMIHWSFPVNSQRDIKKFQVFRRSSVNHPFELVKEYDFDDSVVKFESHESFEDELTEVVSSAKTFFYDDDFIKESVFIYSVVCVDAHGLSSNYSAQYEVKFDEFKNKLVKTLISHTSAPKSYPNLYVENELMRNSVLVNGESSKIANIYFNPEYYYVKDDQDKKTKVVVSKQENGQYVFTFLNLDSMEQKNVTVKIDDRTSSDKT
jgi:hypothetical protein